MKVQLYSLLASTLSLTAAAQGVYTLSKTIPWAPATPKSVDQSAVYNSTYYLSDRTSAGVHVISLKNNNQTTFIGGFTTTKVNGSVVNSNSGPNGLIVLPDRNELWTGDGFGVIRVIDLLTNKIVANISTGSTHRADEFAYDAKTSTVVVTNPNEDTDYVSIVNASTRAVLGKVIFDNATGLEQPAFNPANGLFYVAIDSSPTYPGGGIAALNLASPSNYSISKVIPLSKCIPGGIVFGSTANQLFVSCSSSQFPTFGTENSYVIDVSTGATIANVSGVSGVDQVTYSGKTKYYYASAYLEVVVSSGAPSPVLSVVAANGTVVQNIVTDNVTAHAVAVDDTTGNMLVPVASKGVLVYTLGSNGTNSTATSSATSSAKSSATGSSTAAASNAAGQQTIHSLAMVLGTVALGAAALM